MPALKGICIVLDAYWKVIKNNILILFCVYLACLK